MEHSEILPSLREDSAYSDLLITCGAYAFEVHRVIVCLRSKWFQTAVQHGRWRESTNRTVDIAAIDPHADNEDIDRDHPDAVHLMLDWMYMDDYDLAVCEVPMTPIKVESPIVEIARSTRSRTAASASASTSGSVAPWQSPVKIHDYPLSMHARLYAMGAKYDMLPLKRLALRKLKRALKRDVKHAGFAQALMIGFGSTIDTDRGVRDYLIKKFLKGSGELSQDSVVERAVNSIGGLAFELLKQQSAFYVEAQDLNSGLRF